MILIYAVVIVLFVSVARTEERPRQPGYEYFYDTNSGFMYESGEFNHYNSREKHSG